MQNIKIDQLAVACLWVWMQLFTLQFHWNGQRRKSDRALPVAFLHQRLPLFFAGVLLAFISLIKYLLRCRTPFETVSSHPLRAWLPLVSDWSSRSPRSARTVSGMVEFWEKKQDLILTAWVTEVRALNTVELCGNKRGTRLGQSKAESW